MYCSISKLLNSRDEDGAINSGRNTAGYFNFLIVNPNISIIVTNIYYVHILTLYTIRACFVVALTINCESTRARMYYKI